MTTLEAVERKMMSEVIKQLDDIPISASNISPLEKRDTENSHKRLYLVAWNDDDGYTHIYLVTVSASGDNIYSEIKYEDCVLIDDFVEVLSDVIAYANEIKESL